MSEAETLFGEKHVQRYRETGGEVGHRWKRGSKILLLTTKGRKSGEPRTKPLIYEEDGDRYVIVASKGGAPAHPGWYRNLQKDPNVELQVLDEVYAPLPVEVPGSRQRVFGFESHDCERELTAAHPVVCSELPDLAAVEVGLAAVLLAAVPVLGLVPVLQPPVGLCFVEKTSQLDARPLDLCWIGPTDAQPE